MKQLTWVATGLVVLLIAVAVLYGAAQLVSSASSDGGAAGVIIIFLAVGAPLVYFLGIHRHGQSERSTMVTEESATEPDLPFGELSVCLLLVLVISFMAMMWGITVSSLPLTATSGVVSGLTLGVLLTLTWLAPRLKN